MQPIYSARIPSESRIKYLPLVIRLPIINHCILNQLFAMATLIIRHGYRTKMISERHTEKIPIAKRNGELHFAKFGGFIQQSDSLVWSVLAGLSRVKVITVFGFSQTDGYLDVQYFGYNAIALGYYSKSDDTVSMPLFDGFPLVWCELRIADSADNLTNNHNVFSLLPGDNQRGNT